MDKEHMKDKLLAPTPSAGDKGHAVVRAGLGAIPFFGQSAIEVFTEVITPPIERRRDEWMRHVGEMLKGLSEERKIDLDELQKNDSFIDLLMNASHTAMRNSNKEKREALKNAVQNTALGQAPEEALQQMFIRWIDEFTVWHLRLLKLFQNPKAWAERNNHKFPSLYSAGLDSILESAYPELEQKRSFYDQVWSELDQRGLVNTNALHTGMTERGLYSCRASDMGKEFLSFIEQAE